MYKLSRYQSRKFFFDTWHKYQNKESLSDMEKITLNVILLHPEYHFIFNNTDSYHDKDFPPEMGSTNPFLHMSMHIAIKEQVSIDQPTGIKKRFNRLQKKNNDEHKTTHEIMECLAEMLWQAQRNQSAPDVSIYFECLDK
tara:strand:- start:7435 stop:7854 length:420 start_codon:yes stop_codon:yes gene_type:complete